MIMNQYQGMSPTGGLMGAFNAALGSAPTGGIMGAINSALGPAPMSGAPNSIQTGLLAPASPYGSPGANPPTFQLGPWSQMAYQMAGSPHQGPYPSVEVPPAAAGGSGSTAGGIGGLLMGIGQNPALASQLAGFVKGLLPSNNSSGDGGYNSPGGLGTLNLSTMTPGQLLGGYPSNGFISSQTPGQINLSTTNLDDLTPEQLFGTTFGNTSGFVDDGGFSSAGGAAATQSAPTNSPTIAATSGTTGLPSASGMLGDVQSGLGIVSGLSSGTPMGDASAAISAAKLGAATGVLPSQAGAAAGAAAPVLGLISGIQQGGPMGDAQAAESAGQLANSAGLLGSGAGAALGAAGLGLGVASVPFLLNALLPDPTDVPNFNDVAFIQSLTGTPGSSYLQQAAASYFNQHGTLDGNFWQSIGVNPYNPGMGGNPEPQKRTVLS